VVKVSERIREQQDTSQRATQKEKVTEMSRTQLYAVRRHIPILGDGTEIEVRFMVYKPFNHSQGVTWTKNIAKASRWMNEHDARRFMSDALQRYDIPFSQLRIEAV